MSVLKRKLEDENEDENDSNQEDTQDRDIQLPKKVKNDIENDVEDEVEDEDENEDEDEDGILKNERTIENRIQDVSKYVKQSIVDKEDKLPLPNSSDSQHHGFCYVGKQNNLRHCAKVSSKSTCMSGDIFPTMDLCINPKLR